MQKQDGEKEVKKNIRFCVLGGDARMHYLAASLQEWQADYANNSTDKQEMKDNVWQITEHGNPLAKSALSRTGLLARIEESDVVILPVPVSADGIHVKWGNEEEEPLSLSALVETLHEKQQVFGGAFKADLYRQLKEKKLQVTDFMQEKAVAEKNAVATAEGAIAEAVRIMPGNLEKSRCLVVGYGVCGRAIASRLKALGAETTVMARRREVREEAGKAGYAAVDMFEKTDQTDAAYQLVINTVPARVLSAAAIDSLPEKTVIIDIASQPGGTDFAYCQKKGITALHCLGIPGKYAPGRSGEILAEEVMRAMIK